MNEIKNQTPKEIANLIEWKIVYRALSYHYGKKWKQLEPVFKHLKTIKVLPRKDKGEFLEVKCGGFIGEEDRFYSIHTNKYSLSFRKWGQTANIPFDEETLRRYKPEELMAHYLYEITWYGTEKDMLKKGRMIRNSVRKIKRGKICLKPN